MRSQICTLLHTWMIEQTPISIAKFKPHLNMAIMNNFPNLLLLLFLLSSPTPAAVAEAAPPLTRPGFTFTRARGKCTPQYWSSRTESWPRMVPQMSTVSNVFGSRAAERYRFDLTLLEAASGGDGVGGAFAGMVKESTAALLNAYARKGYPYSAWEVKTMVIQGLISRQAAAAQTRRFREANLACNQRQL